MDGGSPKQELIAELMEFGFDEFYILKAVEITLDKEKAAQIVMKLVEEGPDTDLSMYQPGFQAQGGLMEEPPLVAGTAAVAKPNRAKMLFVVNGSLKMGKGKICGQVGHAVIGAYLQIEETSRFDERSRLRLSSWENSGGAKIVVRANNLEEMKKIKETLEKMEIGINTYIV